MAKKKDTSYATEFMSDEFPAGFNSIFDYDSSHERDIDPKITPGFKEKVAYAFDPEYYRIGEPFMIIPKHMTIGCNASIGILTVFDDWALEFITIPIQLIKRPTANVQFPYSTMVKGFRVSVNDILTKKVELKRYILAEEEDGGNESKS